MTHVVQVKTGKVNRGDLLMVAGGYVVADTLSADANGTPFWYDTDGGRHFPNPTDDTLTVRVATFQTQAIGQSKGKEGARHVLTDAAEPLCPNGRRSGTIDAWQSGTALASVTCQDCRKLIGLVNTRRGERAR